VKVNNSVSKSKSKWFVSTIKSKIQYNRVLIGQVIEESHALCMVSIWPTRNKNIYAENLIHNLTKKMKRSKHTENVKLVN